MSIAQLRDEIQSQLPALPDGYHFHIKNFSNKYLELQVRKVVWGILSREFDSSLVEYGQSTVILIYRAEELARKVPKYIQGRKAAEEGNIYGPYMNEKKNV